MSELKVHKAYNRWIDEEMPTPNDDLICNEVYLKSEADKVIAEKDKVITYARVLVREDIKLIRHQKYKRCLDKAKLCKSEEKRLEAIAPLFDTDKECWEYGSDYYVKWHERWIALAEKFKEVI